MPRNLTAAVLAQIKAEQLAPALFVQMLFSSGWLYVWTGSYPITTAMPQGSAPGSGSNQVWTGVGNLGSISAISDTSDVSAAGITLSLSGIPAGMMTQALGQVRQGNPVFIWQAFLTAAGAIVASPYQAWAGRMDTCTIDDNPDTCTISLTAENRLLDLNRIVERRYVSMDQIIDFPGDTGFDYVPSIQELSIVWGRVSPKGAEVHPSPPPGNGGGAGTSGGGNSGRPTIPNPIVR